MRSSKVVAGLLIAACSLVATAQPSDRFVQKVALPGHYTAVIAEGDLEARSIGSYSVRIYSSEGAQPGDDTTFFTSGVVRARDGAVEKAFIAQLDKGGPPRLVVTIRSAGSGSYLSVDAFAFDNGKVALRASAEGLPPDADPVASLRSKGRRPPAK